MGQLLRLHFNDNDHIFRILNAGPVTRETTTIELLLDGIPLSLIKNEGVWKAAALPDHVSEELVTAVVKNIALRFRI